MQEEIQKLAAQIEFMKIVHMEMHNRHLKPKPGGYFNAANTPAALQSPISFRPVFSFGKSSVTTNEDPNNSNSNSVSGNMTSLQQHIPERPTSFNTSSGSNIISHNDKITASDKVWLVANSEEVCSMDSGTVIENPNAVDDVRTPVYV